MSFKKFAGNCPRNVSKDAKYGIRSGPNGPVVRLVFRSSEGEKWYATTEDHPQLVKMVNDVKLAVGGEPYGSFYINEYRQVIVPVIGETDYYLAGEYDGKLRFAFEGKTLSGEAMDLDNNPLSIGDTWVGPHPGIPYKLCAGGKDISYEISPRPNVVKDIFLSRNIGPEAASKVAGRIRAFKGTGGGPFYINEWRVMFAPISEGKEWRYVYVGRLVEDESWFPKPAE
jgi:hypothetical protein